MDESLKGKPVEEFARGDLVALLYEQVPRSSALSVIVAALLGAVLWPVTKHAALLAWVLVITAISAVRLVLWWRFTQRAEGSEVASWERRFMTSFVASAAAWGFGGLAIMPADSFPHQAVVYFFLLGMLGGAVANYSSHIALVIVSATLIILPATLWFAITGGLLARAMAVGSLIYFIAAWRGTRTVAATLMRSYQLSHDLRVARENAEQQARTDELTEMRNRRAFYELGEMAMAQALRYGESVAVIVLDVDHFKAINDTWGHATGDETLRLVALIIQRTIRTSDIAGRIGGEEFAIMLPRATTVEAAALGERLRAAMAKAPLWHDRGEVHFTASFGIASSRDGANRLDRLLVEADGALYQAKAAGRNRVVCFTPPAS